MPVFQYKALQRDGGLTEGRIEAPGRQDALRLIEGKGLSPVRVEENGQTAEARRAGLSLPGWRKGVPYRVLENFTRQLSSLLTAGISLSRALQIIHKEASHPRGRAHWKAVHDLVIDGTPLADAMSQAPEVFPRVYIAMVRAGETGGFLDVVLDQIAEFQTREKELRGRVLAALIYPIVISFLAVAVLVFLLVFFIPRFKVMFEDFGAALPWLTRAIVGASDFMLSYGIWAVALLVVGIVAARSWLVSEQGRRAWNRLILRTPIFGPLTARFAMTRFCRMLGTLVGAGVPLINSLRVARESIGNQTLTDAVTAAIEQVRQGDSLSTSLADCPELFPGSVLETIAVAEETGRLDKELVRMAGVAEGDLDRQLRMAVSLAEPLLLFLMAGFIGTIFIGMVLPIFAIQDYIN
jgi:type II secretory pathway component PulF